MNVSGSIRKSRLVQLVGNLNNKLNIFMNKNTVEKKIERCVDKLYKDDKYLFESKVCERCLMFRLAYYLQMAFPDYFVDCEFNKMGFKNYKYMEKVEPSEQGRKLKKMFADIIIHKRNSNVQDNFICLEIKPTKKGMDTDSERLKNMTRKNGFRHKGRKYIYAYDFGFFIYLPKDKTRSEIRIFENGAETQLTS